MFLPISVTLSVNFGLYIPYLNGGELQSINKLFKIYYTSLAVCNFNQFIQNLLKELFKFLATLFLNILMRPTNVTLQI